MKTHFFIISLVLFFVGGIFLNSCKEKDDDIEFSAHLEVEPGTQEYPNTTVQIENKSTESCDSYKWDFGDGEVTADENFVASFEHLYEGWGEFVIELTVTKGEVSKTANATIDIESPPINSLFSASPIVQVYPYATVYLENNFGDNYDTYTWVFGNEEGRIDNEYVPYFEYNYSDFGAGIYTITLTATNSDTTITASNTIWIQKQSE